MELRSEGAPSNTDVTGHAVVVGPKPVTGHPDRRLWRGSRLPDRVLGLRGQEHRIWGEELSEYVDAPLIGSFC